MLKKSKLMSLVLALLIAISAILPLSASAAISFSDVPSDHVYYEAITNLVAEGIINGFEDGTYKPEDAVTRAQFTKIICYALYVGDVTYGEEARATFSDVAPNHWAINNIITAKNAKIINGFDDGTFKPDQTVLYEQAVKMAACAIGYPEARASKEGGYPQAYLRFALKQGLLDGVDGKEGEALTRAKVAQLIDNMRNADQIDQETGEITGSLRDEAVSVRSSVEGRIVAINRIPLDYNEVDTTSCKKNQIELELANGASEFYWIDNLNVEDPYDYLGRTVTVYYDKQSGSDSQVTDIVLKNNRNKEYEVDNDDVDLSASGSTELTYYDENGNEKSVSIATGISVIHNGQAVNMSFNDVLTAINGKSGKIKLVCTENADLADVIFVSTYETYYVTSINRSKYTITDTKREPDVTVDLDESVGGKQVSYYKNDKKVSFSDIKQYNAVSIAVSQNGKLYEVLITDKKASGIVASTTGNTFKLNGSDTTYEFAALTYGREGVVAGNYVSLVLDAFGKVFITTVSSATTLEYGYLSAVESSSDMTETKVQAMVYKLSSSSATQKGTIYTLANTVKIDGTSYKPAEDSDLIESKLRGTADNAGINETINSTAPQNVEFAQPIRFAVNSQGEINTILTNEKTGDVSTSMNVTSRTAAGQYLECTTDKTVLGGYSIQSSTKIILVPSNRATGKYETRSNSYFKKGTKYYVQVVNVSTMKVPGAVYVYGIDGGSGLESTTLTEDDMPMIVKNANPATYNGETRTKLELITVDGTETLTVYKGDYDNTSAVDTAQVGDIVRVAYDADYYVTVIETVVTQAVMDPANETGGFSKNEIGETTTDQREEYRVIAGRVRDKSSSNMLVSASFNPSATSTENISIANAKIYAVNTALENNKVRELTIDEINNGSKVFIYTASGTTKLIVIYE